MADTNAPVAAAPSETPASRRNEKVGLVVSTKMQKTIREARPLSKLKRWSLEEIVRRSSLSLVDDGKTEAIAEAK